MNVKTYTIKDLVAMDRAEYQSLQICLRAKSYRLAGWNWTKWISITEEPTGGFTVRWE